MRNSSNASGPAPAALERLRIAEAVGGMDADRRFDDLPALVEIPARQPQRGRTRLRIDKTRDVRGQRHRTNLLLHACDLLAELTFDHREDRRMRLVLDARQRTERGLYIDFGMTDRIDTLGRAPDAFQT